MCTPAGAEYGMVADTRTMLSTSYPRTETHEIHRSDDGGAYSSAIIEAKDGTSADVWHESRPYLIVAISMSRP